MVIYRSFLFTTANALEEGLDKKREFRLLVQLMARLFPDLDARAVFERVLTNAENEDLFEKATGQKVPEITVRIFSMVKL